MQKRTYRKPQLTKLDLSRTPKAWVLLRELLDMRHRDPHLLTAVLALAHYAATLAQGMPTVEGHVEPAAALLPPPDPDRIDHGTDILGDREGRLAGINGVCKRALWLVRSGLHDEALEAVCLALDELGLDRPRCCVVA